MRLAVFTSQFPGRVNTFFARDMRALLEADVSVDIYPLYPLEPGYWRFVPDILRSDVLPPGNVHHLSTADAIRLVSKWPIRLNRTDARETYSILVASSKYGLESVAKSGYAILKALAWAQVPERYDHILAYWGNYSATCAYVFQKLRYPATPLSMFLHAGTDLYRKPAFMRQKLRYFDNLVVVCEFNMGFLRRNYPDLYPLISHKVFLHHLGLDLSEFPFRPAGRPAHKLLGVGSFDKKKGFDYLIRAAEILIRRGIYVDVTLVGEGKEAEALRQLAEQLGIAEHVRFLGWLPFEEVKEAMLDSTILVHPSSGLGDAVPTVIKEAMALGTPVVASRVAGIPELLDFGKCGILVAPRDTNALADAVGSLLVDSDLRQRFALAGRDHMERGFDLWKNGRSLANRLRSTRHSTQMKSSDTPHRSSLYA